MSDANLSKFTWEHAVVDSDLPGTSKHVLLTMSVRMDKCGGSCFPTLEELTAMTGLTKNTVRKYRDIAIKEGWLVMTNMGFRGQKWRRASYVAAIPGTTRCGVSTSEGGALDDPALPKKVGEEMTHVEKEGGSRGDPKVGHVVTQDKEQTNNHTTLEREGASAPQPHGGKGDQPDGSTSGGTTSGGELKRQAEETFKKRFWPKWPGKAFDNRDRALAEFGHLSLENQEKAIAGIGPFHEAQKRAKRTKPLAALTYLKQRKWEDLEGEPAIGSTYLPAVVTPYSPLWSAVFIEMLRTGMATQKRFAFKQICEGQSTTLAFGRERDLELAAAAQGFERVPTHGPRWKAWHGWMERRMDVLGIGIHHMPRLRDDPGNPFWVSVPSDAMAKAWGIALESAASDGADQPTPSHKPASPAMSEEDADTAFT